MQEPIFWREGCWILKFEKKRKIQILCIAAGAFFFLIYPMAGASDFLKPGGVIERNTYGQGDKEGILIVEGLPDGKEEIEIQIKERQYSKKEADNKFEQAFQEVQKEALADKLRTAFAQWYSNGHTDESDPNIIILRIRLNKALLFSHGTRYDMDFGATQES